MGGVYEEPLENVFNLCGYGAKLGSPPPQKRRGQARMNAFRTAGSPLDIPVLIQVVFDRARILAGPSGKI